MKIATIIPARGGSKGIPKKNIVDFCGRPLISWSIQQSIGCSLIDRTYVSSDSEEILTVSESFGAASILRPEYLATDTSTSEEAILHAMEKIEKDIGSVDLFVFLQATSPLRESLDIENAINTFREENADSLFSSSELEDFFIWHVNDEGNLDSFNYDYQKRKRRQDVNKQYVENGSIYVFKPEVMRKNNNRMGGKIATSTMEFWKSHEIDSMEDLELCEWYFKNKIRNK
jgi:N-acylneuraminate cytidylyltransferase